MSWVGVNSSVASPVTKSISCRTKESAMSLRMSRKRGMFFSRRARYIPESETGPNTSPLRAPDWTINFAVEASLETPCRPEPSVSTQMRGRCSHIQPNTRSSCPGWPTSKAGRRNGRKGSGVFKQDKVMGSLPDLKTQKLRKSCKKRNPSGLMANLSFLSASRQDKSGSFRNLDWMDKTGGGCLISSIQSCRQFPVQLQFFLLQPQQRGHTVASVGFPNAALEFALTLGQLRAVAPGLQRAFAKFGSQRFVFPPDDPGQQRATRVVERKRQRVFRRLCAGVFQQRVQQRLRLQPQLPAFASQRGQRNA